MVIDETFDCLVCTVQTQLIKKRAPCLDGDSMTTSRSGLYPAAWRLVLRATKSDSRRCQLLSNQKTDRFILRNLKMAPTGGIMDNQSLYSLLADAVLVTHVLFVVFVVLGHGVGMPVAGGHGCVIQVTGISVQR